MRYLRAWLLVGTCCAAAACSRSGVSVGGQGGAPSPTGDAATTVGSGGGGTAGAPAAAGSGGGPARPDGAVTDAPVEAAQDGGAVVGSDTRDAGTGGTAGANGAAVAPLQFYGRWDFTAGAAITVYSGSHVTARFSGTGISARLDLSHSQAPVTTVTWQIDGGAWTSGDVTANLALATGLPAGEHDVVFMARGMEELFNRWNPPVVASLSFIGFDVQGGALIPSARPARYKIEFLGDSITEGVRIVNNNAADPQHTDGHLAYPCQVALALGAEWRQVGFGHQGILQTGHGNVPVAADSFNWVYATVPRDAWVADMVVLNQGTNDRDATSAAFRPGFARYLGVLRQGYPNAELVVLRPFGGYREADIAAEVASRVAAGDTRIVYVDTTGWLSAADYTEGLHPNLQGTAKIVAALVPELRKHM